MRENVPHIDKGNDRLAPPIVSGISLPPLVDDAETTEELPKRCRHLWTNATLFILFSRTYATLSRTYATLSRTYATLLNNRNPSATLLNLSYLPYLATGKYAVPYLARLTNHSMLR